jgi:hypothetical protein
MRTAHAMPAPSIMLCANPICELSGEERTRFIVQITLAPKVEGGQREPATTVAQREGELKN